MKKIMLLLTMVFLMISCGGSKEEKNTEGQVTQETKELNIYTWSDFIPDEIIEGFQKETGVKVNISYYDNNDVLIAKLMSGAKGYDIISPSTDYVDVLIKTGLIQKLDKSKLQEVYANLDPALKLEEFSKIYDPGLEYSIPYSFSATGVIVNKKFVPNYPKGMEIFNMAEYKGKMTMLDDGRETLGLTLQYLGYPSDSANDQELEAAKKQLLEWKKNLAKFDATTFGKSVATGEFYISHGYAENVFGGLDPSEYDNFDYFIPKGAMMYIDSMALVKDAPNSENAYKFLQYVYKPENFIKVYEHFRAPSVVKGVEEKSEVKALVKASQVVENGKLPAALSDEAKEKQDKIWNEIKLGN